MFKRIACAAALFATVFGGNVHADTLMGKKLAASENGQPACSEPAKLTEYMLAALADDKVALRAIHKEGDCAMVKAGTAVSVLQEMNDDDEDAAIYVVKARFMNKKGGSVVA